MHYKTTSHFTKSIFKMFFGISETASCHWGHKVFQNSDFPLKAQILSSSINTVRCFLLPNIHVWTAIICLSVILSSINVVKKQPIQLTDTITYLFLLWVTIISVCSRNASCFVPMSLHRLLKSFTHKGQILVAVIITTVSSWHSQSEIREWLFLLYMAVSNKMVILCSLCQHLNTIHLRQLTS